MQRFLPSPFLLEIPFVHGNSSLSEVQCKIYSTWTLWSEPHNEDKDCLNQISQPLQILTSYHTKDLDLRRAFWSFSSRKTHLHQAGNSLNFSNFPSILNRYAGRFSTKGAFYEQCNLKYTVVPLLGPWGCVNIYISIANPISLPCSLLFQNKSSCLIVIVRLNLNHFQNNINQNWKRSL